MLNNIISSIFSISVIGLVYYYIYPLFPIITAIIASLWFKYLYFDKKSEIKKVLNPKEWKNFVLIKKLIISHNVALYRFKLPNPDDVLGLPIGQHISVEADINGKVIQRSYTPTSSDDDLGHFDLVIKSYPNGNVSKYFAELEIGQTISVKGPKGQFKYTPGLVRAFGMIAGGTGITPMLQIVRAIVKNPNDKTTVNLIFANVTVDDILLKEELDLLAKNHENFNVFYTLDKPPNDWNGGRGFVTQDMIKKFCPPPANDIKILLCGPPPMISAMSKNCEALGYEKSRTISRLEDQVFKF